MRFKLNVLALAVYATMRNLAKREALEEAAGRTLGSTLEIKQLDVCDDNSIKACVDSLPMRRVDILSKAFLDVFFTSEHKCNALTCGHISIFFPRIPRAGRLNIGGYGHNRNTQGFYTALNPGLF